MSKRELRQLTLYNKKRKRANLEAQQQAHGREREARKKKRNARSERQKAEQLSSAQRFIRDGWELAGEGDMNFSSFINAPGSVNRGRRDLCSPEDIADCLFTDNLMQNCAKSMSASVSRALTTGKGTKTGRIPEPSWARYMVSPSSAKEFRELFAWHLLETAGNKRLSTSELMMEVAEGLKKSSLLPRKLKGKYCVNCNIYLYTLAVQRH